LYGDGNSINYNPVGVLGDTIIDTLQYQYCNLGDYIPSVFIDDGTCSGLVSNDTVHVDSLVVDFDVQNYSICDTGTVCFTDMSYHEIAGNTAFTSWYWDFGDGNSSTVQNPCHLYTDTGFFDVKLVVVSDFTCTDSIVHQIYIPPSPTAQLDRSAPNGCVGITISFYDSSQVSSNTYINTWHWDFGDNSILTDTANTQHTSYQFNTAGLYWVSLTVTDTFGCSSIDSVQIEVFDLPIVSAGLDTTICFGDSTILQANGAITYDWQPLYNIFNESTANPTVYPAIDTAYFVVGTDINGCENNDTIFVKVNNIQANFYVDSVCLSTPSNFTDLSTSDTTINSWQWDFDEPSSGINNTSNVQNPTHTYGTNGIYNVTLSISDEAGCNSDTTLPAIVFDIPIASFTADSVCIGIANTFNADSSYGGGAPIIDYFWNFGQNPEDTSHIANPTFTYDNPGLYNVCLTVITSQNCVGNTDDTCFTVQVYPLPNVNAGNDQIICENDSVQLLATGALTYTWSPNYQISDVNVTNPWVKPLVDTSYIVSGTDANTCVNTDTVSVSVNFVTAYFEADSVCVGNSNSFNDLSVADGNIQSWSWTFDDPSSGANNTSILQNPTHTYATAGTYNVELSITDDNGCTDDTIVQVVVFDAPMASYTADSVCFNQANTFNSSSSYAGGATIVDYFWNFGQNVADTSHLANPTFTYNNAGLYNVCLTITTNQNCANNFDDTCFTVQVYELPQASFSVDSACMGSNNTLVNSSTDGNDALINSSFWNFGQNVTDTLTISGAPSNTQFTYDTSGVYNVTLTVTDENMCQSSVSQNAYVYNVPVANFNYTSNCQNQENDFIALPTNVTTAITYTWNFDEGAGYVLGDSVETYSFTNAGVHNVALIIENIAGCSDTSLQTINVSAAPTAIITGDTVVCNGSSTQLSGANSISSVPITVYDWNISPSQTSTITYLPNGDNTVTLVITNADGCIDSTSVFIDVVANPSVTIVADPACEDIPINMEADVTLGDANVNIYNWTVVNTANNTSTYSTNPISYTATGIDTLTATVVVQDENGCVDSITQTILVDEQATLTILQDEFLICPNETVYLSLNDNIIFSSTGGIGNVAISPIVGAEIFTADSFALSPSSTTNYTITVSSVLGNCPDDNDNVITVGVAPTPFIELNAVPNPVIAGAVSEISAAVVPFNFNTDSLIWEDVNGTLNRTLGFEIEATPLEETTYPVHLVYAYDSLMCRIDTSITIQVITECGPELVYVPNIFTPNNDGKNDVFKLTGYGIQTVNFLRIFDRWGQIMYNGENVGMSGGYMDDGWHGDNKGGKACNSGVYVYYYEIICTNGDIVKGSGNVTLIK
ncbi:MAG: PKD domain-containing protein, partial [Bacteroidetes bacterium]|nr:PKD domain-containing protein [Bacteroidota bacterium]